MSHMRPRLALPCVAIAAVCMMCGAEAARTQYVAPDLETGLSAKNQQYLIGVLSFLVVVIATVLGVKSMTDINYDDDTLLMVEVPEELHHDE